ncbi:MAG: nitrogenase [Oscillatoria sp. SIO1A7]|nr:nitrogenase [Oscillatoria sp. SIO1A7]
MDVADKSIESLTITSWVDIEKINSTNPIATNIVAPRKEKQFKPLRPLRQWLEELDVRNLKLARALCRLIPARCPFEREVKLFGRTLLSIPPMCKLNPVYEELMMLRFRALSYLADECGEDVSKYC